MMRPISAFFVSLLLTAAPAAVAGQSLFNSAGLGRPLEAVDARARALGSFGIGLQGGSIAPNTDPAAAARLPFPSGVMVGQPTWVEASRGSVEAGHFRGTRFPLLGIAYPLLGGMGTVHLGSVLDQRFHGERPVTIDLGGTSHEVMDVFTQEGGVSTAGLGYARMLGDRLSVGITVGRYTGSVIRELTRNFGDLDLDGTESFTTSGFWSYSGTTVTAGATADVGSIGRLAASATWSSGLDADASSETAGADRSYDLPMELRVGGSAVLAPGLLLVASAVHADWSTLQEDLSGGVTAHGTTGFGIGVELSQVRLLARRAPLRLGYRRSGLPFALGEDSATESAFTGGLGFLFNEANGIVLAGVDLSVERGERSAGSIVEQFWRGTVALRVSGL